MMTAAASRGSSLTLGAQPVRAVLGGLAAAFAHLAAVLRRRRVAAATALPLALAAAHAPLAPLVPAAVNCNTQTHTHRAVTKVLICTPRTRTAEADRKTRAFLGLTSSNLVFISGSDVWTCGESDGDNRHLKYHDAFFFFSQFHTVLHPDVSNVTRPSDPIEVIFCFSSCSSCFSTQRHVFKVTQREVTYPSI